MEELNQIDVFEQDEDISLWEKDENSNQNNLSKNKLNNQEADYRKKLIKKHKQKQRIKNRKVAKQKERRQFLESLPLEERKQFIYAEKDARKESEAKIIKQLETAPKVYFDLSFCDTMIFKELKSLIVQVNNGVNVTKQFDRIFSLHLTSFKDKVKETWERGGVSKLLLSKHECSIEDLHLDLENTIYLSPDSENVLDSFDPKITNFIIGGIVDRSVTKNMTLEKAKAIGIKCGKLPLFDHLSGTTKLVLNINTVFKMLLRYGNNNQDWKDAISQSMPTRHINKCRD